MSNSPLAVIKIGGDMVIEKQDRIALAENINDLVNAGWRCVILHGAGPQLTQLQAAHGLPTNKVDGRRITSVADLKVVKQALCGEVNVDVVAALVAQGIPAFGCHGASAKLIEAEKRPPVDMGAHGIIDFGEVGDVTHINNHLISQLLSIGVVPVIASIGVSSMGRVFNINADTTVTAIAESLKAELLILSTKVGGIYRNLADPQSRISEITPSSAQRLIDSGVITDGMIPKVKESLASLRKGVGCIVITNAAQKGRFLDAAKGNNRFATKITFDG